ncbi:solute carrier family member 5 [Stylonychia lemnae]|uniref:Solute carrier family member 5 n=1 Tax=Stylonychia lemnae TaxID=5949 RepID=A0A078B7X1_STYLE|nr:solute carrier family member 5 [Stylonychia lemnae]|eukprot:CDW90620.1 solute carrier family member 5 [Stylonychia lemnae]
MKHTQFDNSSGKSTKIGSVDEDDSPNPQSSNHGSAGVDILTLDQAFERLGGFSYFQLWASSLFIWAFTTGGCLAFAFSMLEKPPKYLCFNKDGTTYECKADQTFCKDPSIKYKIDWDDPTSLHNWVESLDLTCESASRIGMIGSMFFVGYMSGAFTLPRISICMSRKLNLTLVLICGFGFASLGRAAIGFLYMQEMTPDKYKTFIGSFAQISIGITPAILALYHLYITKDWLPFQAFSAFTTLLVTISIIALPESPQYLISKKRYDEARKSLETIARWNRYDGPIDFKFKDEDQALLQSDEETYLKQNIPYQDANKYESANDQNQNQYTTSADCDTLQSSRQDRIKLKEPNQNNSGSIKEILKQKQHACNLFIMITVWIAASFDYYQLNFQMKYIKGDFFTNILVAALTETIAYIVSGYLVQKIGIRRVLIFCYSVSIIGGLMLIVFQDRSQGYLIPFSILLARFGISAAYNICYLVSAVIFPTVFAGTAFGLCNLFAKMTTIFSPIVAEAAAPIPMISYCLLALVPCILANFLILDGIEEKQDKNKKRTEIISEIIPE